MTKAKTILIRNVPAGVHRRLKTRAAIEGMSLSDYMRRAIVKVAEQPTQQAGPARLGARAAVRLE